LLFKNRDVNLGLEIMKFIKQKIKGVYLVQAEPFEDGRGIFRRHFCQKEFKKHGINPKVTQANIIRNKKKHTLRGFHYQQPPYNEAKTYTCFRGAFHFIVLDINPKSPTYLKWQGFSITEKDRFSLHVPDSCTNASLSLADNSLIHYYVSQFYKPGKELGIRYNDPYFKFKWPAKPKIISTKDKSHPDFTPNK
jgi:dTDP-4-dehydrorhamnose 3,5-epimerase